MSQKEYYLLRWAKKDEYKKALQFLSLTSYMTGQMLVMMGKIIMVKNFKNKYLNKLDRPYFIAEIGINHNGRLPLALKMIKKQKRLEQVQ